MILYQGLSKLYTACPYCFTEINKTEPDSDNPPEETQVEVSSTPEMPGSNQEKTSNCHYHFGFLKAKERKQQIPEECFICTDITDCMLEK
jgi:hypothetical protein